MLNQQELKRLFFYDPIVGIWIRLTKGPAIRLGSFAGTIDASGYRIIKIKGKSYLSSRLAFLYMCGSFPEKSIDIDHKNRIRSDDRWANLRKATRRQNAANGSCERRNNTSGYKGVMKQPKTEYWLAYSKRYGTIGSYKTKEEAARAYDKAAILQFGEFANLNFPRSDYPKIPSLDRKVASNNNVTGFRGVSPRKNSKKFRAFIWNPLIKKNENLGTFNDPILAAKFYDKRAIEIFGTKAILNFTES